MNLSIVIPVYNSSEILNKLIDEIQLSLFNKKIIFEIVLVNDASNDDSWDKIKKLSERHKVVTGINLKYNFGQHNAIIHAAQSRAQLARLDVMLVNIIP